VVALTRGHLADLAAASAFAVLAFGHFTGRWDGTRPFPLLTGDAAHYASFAAARDHPDFFAGDELLSDPSNIALYASLPITVVRWLAPIAGDYGTAFVWLVGPHLFVQALGFYLLGCVLLRSRWWGFLLALILLPHVPLQSGEYWGVHRDAQARFSFQAMLPFVLAAIVWWSERPARWLWPMAALGLMTFVHPVSAPAWGLAAWLGCGVLLPSSWPMGKRWRWMAALAAVFAVPFAAYAARYLAHHVHGQPPGEAPGEILAIIGYGRENLIHVGAALHEFASASRGSALFWMGALFGAALAWRSARDERERRLVATAISWVAAIVLVSVSMPWLDQTWAQRRSALPLETDLSRNLRYLVPLMLLFCLWPLAIAAGRAPTQWLRSAIVAAGLAVTGSWWVLHPPNDNVGYARPCWTSGHLFCPVPRWQPLVETIEAVKTFVPRGGRLLATRLEGQIRYATLRPLVYAYKDQEQLSYSNHALLRQWFAKRIAIEGVERRVTRRARLTGMVALAQRWRAGYVLLQFPAEERLLDGVPATLLWSSPNGALLRVEAGEGEGAE
jgi:hypothetical protein